MAQRETPRLPSPAATNEYLTDAWQRSILFLDVMRRRAAQYQKHAAELAPNVLDCRAELVRDGRRLERPVNYLLARIVPSEGVEIDPHKRPFVIVDPRAGHRPGIGGFKADSEIGVAMKAGHPAYFIGFLPDPEPGQTILDIASAEATFLETVIARHPEAEGKPCVIGDCLAGWAVMIVNALRPELFGPIIIAGAPLSYWTGVRGRDPMRYSGGLLGGSWLTALAGDLGAGIFDGAALVQNFENQNPANTLWTKQYNLWSKIDTEPARYLEFEKWWGGHVTLNAEEIQWIVDELFVGNRLAVSDIRAADGTAIDLRGVRSPIVVFCSKGDNISPPQHALDWILDLYDSEDDIRAWGQTIVYTIQEKVGHLGIFVSAGVARKEHDEFVSNIDLIDVLPTGLHEAVLTPKGEAVDNPDLVTGDWLMRCEARTLDDIRALGGNDLADERKFEAAAGVSEETFHAVYRTPALQAALGVDTASKRRPRKAARSKLHDALVEHCIASPRDGITHGGLRQALVRALIWIGMARNAVDERGFVAITRLRDAHPASRQMSLADFKALVREQYLMLVVDEEAALRAIPGLMPEPADERREACAALQSVIEASGTPEGARAERLRRVAALFGLGPELVGPVLVTSCEAS